MPISERQAEFITSKYTIAYSINIHGTLESSYSHGNSLAVTVADTDVDALDTSLLGCSQSLTMELDFWRTVDV